MAICRKRRLSSLFIMRNSVSIGHVKPRSEQAGFTLIELMLAISIAAFVMVAGYVAFSVATTAWKVSITAGDGLHHADYVAGQLVMGLRSAYYPDDGRDAEEYGLVLTDDGDGEGARDGISWCKLGSSMVGGASGLAETPHRVEISVMDGTGDDPGGLYFRAWRLFGQEEDFDPAEAVEAVLISPYVVGFDCRVRDPMSPDDEIEWFVGDEWIQTNKIPPQVEFSFYITPPREGDDPVEVKRIVSMPLSALSFLNRRARGSNRSNPARARPDTKAPAGGVNVSAGRRPTNGRKVRY